MTFDPEANAAYVRLANVRPGDATVQVFVDGIPSRADVILDFNSDGKLLGIEVIGARTALSAELLALAEPARPPHDD